MDPWSKGDYSRIVREASMVVEKVLVVILPSGRVPGEFSWRSRSWKRGGGGTEMRSRKRVPLSRVLGRVLNIGQRVTSEGTWGAQAPPRRGQEGGRATRAPGALVASLRLSFGVLEGSGTLIFHIFFPEFFWQFS